MKKSKAVHRPNLVNSRKVLRKKKRQQKKIHRQEHYLNKITKKSEHVAGQFVKRPADAQDTEVAQKKRKLQQPIEDVISRERKKELKEAATLKSEMQKRRKEMLFQANDEEDKMIKKLEKQLGLKKSKNKNNHFADDGLDYLLEICDRTTSEQIVAAEKHLAEVEADSDFEEDLATVTGKEIDNKKKSKKEKEPISEKNKIHDDDNESLTDEDSADDKLQASEESDDSVDENSSIDDDKPEEVVKKNKDLKNFKQTKVSKEKLISEDDLNKVFSDDEVSHLSSDVDEDGFSGDEIGEELDVEDKSKSDAKPDVWEDIYGRKRDKEGKVIKEEKGAYVPPHLRNKDSSSDKDTVQLKRQIKSFLNKLAGTNLHWACNSIEKLYYGNSRHSVNSCLYGAWTEALGVGLGAASSTPPRLLTEHAALIAVLHANQVGDVGPYFLQELCKKFDIMMQSPQPMKDKTLDNLVSCLANLYNFKVYQANLLYDIMNRLLVEVSEKNIECVLTALRCVGGSLRRDDPQALKNFIQHTQSQAQAKAGDAVAGSRIKFLLEVLMAIKNNNLNKIPNYDPTYTEELNKSIRAVIRKGNYVTPLNIGLEDLLKADERGKWWVVGSAWEGNSARTEKATKPVPSGDQKLLELARKQRMNTDVRKSIFCVIMSAEDYMDAFEKLQHLGLKGQQEREIVHVLLACCLQENTYNPYYAVLGNKLCSYDRKYQLSIQYSVWDKIKEIENMSKQTMKSLAQFLIHLIMEKGLPLSILKVIQFSDLNKSLVKFMRQILLGIIMNADLQVALEVFSRIAKPPNLRVFRESLKLFIQHFLIKNAGKKNSILNEEEMSTLRERTLEVNKILTMYESKIML